MTDQKPTEQANEPGPDLLRMIAGRLGVLGALRQLRRMPERRLHTKRRERLLQHLRTAPLPRAVLFVCHGNIYRSPYAAYVFRALLPADLRGRIEVSSAGFVGPGRRSPEDALEVSAARGIEMSDHRSSLLTAERVSGADLIVVVDPVQKRSLIARFPVFADRIIILGDLDPLPIETRSIPDPWGRDRGVLQSSYRRVERCVRVLTATLISAAKTQPSPVDRP